MPGRKLPDESRQEDILRAAYDVAARRGLGALTVRAVAQRAKVSHGTVLFHFRRRDLLVAALLDRVLYATTTWRVPYDVERLTQPAARLLDMLRLEMERLSTEARHFRLLLEYWAMGVRRASIRGKLTTALTAYRTGWRDLCDAVVVGDGSPAARSTRGGRTRHSFANPDGVAAVAVSLVHGCALQAVVDPTGFDIRQHYDAAARMLDAVIFQRQDALLDARTQSPRAFATG